MKNIKILIFSLFMAFAALNTGVAKAQVEVGADVTFSVFHDNLQAYGRWENHPTYGQVWVSNERDFIPYRTNGHWAYTDDGWTWVSDYAWGWAPFHYGRWDYDQAYGGYYWVPGYEWGPAWVSWRSDNTNYGWAPLRPNISVGIGISFGSDIPDDRWTFVPNRYITSPSVSRYYVPRERNTVVIHNTVIINNAHNNGNRVVVVGGPQRTDVERYTKTSVTRYAVANNTRPGTRVEKNTINIYRPVINKTTVINKTVINNNKTVVNNNNKTVINKNSNNKVVNNNTKVNVKKNTTVNNNKKVEVNKNTVNNNKKVAVKNTTVNNTKKVAVKKNTTVNTNNKKVEVNNKTVVKKPAPVKKPVVNKPVVKKPAPQPNRPAVKARPQAKPKQDDRKKPD